MIKTQPETEQLLTVREAAKALRVHEMTIKRWIQAGVLDAVKLPGTDAYRQYRIKQSVVDAIAGKEQAG